MEGKADGGGGEGEVIGEGKGGGGGREGEVIGEGKGGGVRVVGLV